MNDTQQTPPEDTSIETDSGNIIPNRQPESPVAPIVSSSDSLSNNQLNNTSHKPFFRKLWPIIVIFLLIIVALVALFLFHRKSDTPKNSSSSISSKSSYDTSSKIYTSSAFGFSAWFPITPYITHDGDITLPNGASPNGTQWSADPTNVDESQSNTSGVPYYSVDETDMPAGQSYTPAQLGDSLTQIYTNATVNGAPVTILSNKETQIDNTPAYMIESQSPASAYPFNPSYYEKDIFTVKNNHIFWIYVDTVSENDSTVSKFINSFKFN
ncbi:MAG TPA: hypothetical protein VMQ52_00340 [Candidatus Saccharimonadales bacterium]|jgi:hypothetical protein|nr:hypothetical protein [Candidatus Saccharimonadales bacterium]